MTTRFWLEVGPLREGDFTGLSQVTAALADRMVRQSGRAVGFFYGRAVVPDDVVAAILDQGEGEQIEFYLARAEPVAPATDCGEAHVAIFPNRKTCRRGFDLETQIVHDLSALLTPQFHDRHVVAFHAQSLADDVRGNDLTFCVSEATRDDVLRYLDPPDPARVVTVPLGPGLPGVPMAVQVPAGLAAEPYVVVLGTVEPRKNIEQVLQFLSEQPRILTALRFVFLGRHGWGAAPGALLERHGLTGAALAGRVLFPGYVSATVRDALVARARLLIYPSLFEGFGLPVLEALHAGTPCLTTRSSSLPEVGGEVCAYFDPFVPGDFGRGLAQALQDTPARQAARRGWAARFGWDRCWETIASAIEAVVPTVRTGMR
jgi:glycosyltransferase involved in cell wall biosynthesis